ncbi:MAG: NUDIX hydrolase [Candidatus Moraniibacteriota bacterium]|nr:MAG: NUDIX hydrolase [Candidatus Moranbacteria bacterium]
METKINNWEELSREVVFQKYGRGVEKRVFRLPDGKEADFFLSTGHSSIACLALTKDWQVILVREFRPGPAEVLIELPGGGVSPGENVESAIARELLEETGYRGNVTFITSVLPSAYATYRKNAAVVIDCEKVAEPKLEDNGEEVEALLMSLDEFRAHIRTGHMTDVEIAYLGLDYLGLL